MPNSRHDGVRYDGPQRRQLGFGVGIPAQFPLHRGREPLFPVRIGLAGQARLEEPGPRPAGVPPLRQALHSRTLGHEGSPSLLDGRGQPFAADPRGRGRPRDSLFVDLPCAFQREEDKAARIGGGLRRATRYYASPRPGPALRGARCGLAATDRQGLEIGLRLVGGSGDPGRRIGHARFGKGGALADRLSIRGSSTIAPHGAREITETRRQVCVEGEAAILESVDELFYPAPESEKSVRRIVLVVEPVFSVGAIDEGGYLFHDEFSTLTGGAIR